VRHHDFVTDVIPEKPMWYQT